MVRDLTGLLDHLGLRRAHLVGHSMGAMIAAYAAAHHGDRVATVSLLAGPFYPDSAAYARDNDAIAKDLAEGRGMINFYRARGVNDSVAAVVNAQMLARNDAPSLAAMTASLGGLVVEPARVATVRVPALVAVGTRDALLEHNRWLAAQWPGAQLVEVRDATHINIDRQPSVLHAIRERLRAAPTLR